MGGHNTLVVHNTCEDSLLAAPIILDLAVLAELFQPFHPIFSMLSYLCKAPLVPSGAPLVNALSRQRAAIENVLRACVGLPPLNHMGLEHRMSDPAAWRTSKTAAAAAGKTECSDLVKDEGGEDE